MASLPAQAGQDLGQSAVESSRQAAEQTNFQFDMTNQNLSADMSRIPGVNIAQSQVLSGEPSHQGFILDGTADNSTNPDVELTAANNSNIPTVQADNNLLYPTGEGLSAPSLPLGQQQNNNIGQTNFTSGHFNPEFITGGRGTPRLGQVERDLVVDNTNVHNDDQWPDMAEALKRSREDYNQRHWGEYGSQGGLSDFVNVSSDEYNDPQRAYMSGALGQLAQDPNQGETAGGSGPQ